MKTAMRIFSVVGLVSALSACAPDFDPPPDYKGGYLWNSDRSRTITVEGGDTLYTISQRYDVPTKVIADRNGLQPPYQLTAGQTLILDPTQVHVVADGDTLAAVAQRYNVDQSALAAANELRPPYQLHAGLELWIPDPFTNAAAGSPRGTAVASVASTDLPPVTAAPTSNHPITSETLPPVPGAATGAFGSAAGAANASASAAATNAGVSAGVGIAEQPLSSPVAVQPAPPRLGPPQPVPIAPPPSAVVPPSQATAPLPAAPAMPPALAPAQNEVALAVPNPAGTSSAAHFTWPVTGKVVAKFGPAGKGLHNDGINIAAPAGTQVRAADTGEVVYAGNELRGFGNLLLIKHAEGWTTAYAHNDKLLVNKGDKVSQGQVIATVGRTGNVDSPQLHFEVRKGTQAMDPLEYLAKVGG